eukprot:10208511-Alexandrium_andersonii.AAC.1
MPSGGLQRKPRRRAAGCSAGRGALAGRGAAAARALAGWWRGAPPPGQAAVGQLSPPWSASVPLTTLI